jgi:hypothetical protein
MKYLILLFCLLGATRLHAQQAKAYETIYYSATVKRLHFKLIYADGYLPGTKAKLNNRVFLPVSGTPEINGDFVLQSGTNKIILLNINEEAPAVTISAKYAVKGQVLKLTFKKQQ